jgi:hypothetical protein
MSPQYEYDAVADYNDKDGARRCPTEDPADAAEHYRIYRDEARDHGGGKVSLRRRAVGPWEVVETETVPP